MIDRLSKLLSFPRTNPARVLSSAPPKPNTPSGTTAPESSVPRKVGGPPRTLGSGPSSGSGNGSAQEDARRKAAEAAEARLSSKKPKGTLGKKLQEEQSQTLETVRKNASAVERQKRDADAAADARAYN
ncbi:hypothetical protein DID88_003518 [Monilinia fructigena]|uniref:Uncharacterized protein n=1 Tax=Monilinia fructigena TaxID=38457 RepID=A0A395IU97_9HELO|nr:hypothetical protein DID88_003518 [Monilinia fructigena]